MKNFLLFTSGLLLVAALGAPYVSSAAPLTNEQANSLIGVVQSSPDTPASAFTNLITAFSNITVAQAESLITVVQASSGAPANAFVELLVAFTVDPQEPSPNPTTDSTATNESKTFTLPNGHEITVYEDGSVSDLPERAADVHDDTTHTSEDSKSTIDSQNGSYTPSKCPEGTHKEQGVGENIICVETRPSGKYSPDIVPPAPTWNGLPWGTCPEGKKWSNHHVEKCI